MLQIADLVAGKWLKGIGGASRDRTDDLIVANVPAFHLPAFVINAVGVRLVQNRYNSAATASGRGCSPKSFLLLVLFHVFCESMSSQTQQTQPKNMSGAELGCVHQDVQSLYVGRGKAEGNALGQRGSCRFHADVLLGTPLACSVALMVAGKPILVAKGRRKDVGRMPEPLLCH